MHSRPVTEHPSQPRQPQRPHPPINNNSRTSNNSNGASSNATNNRTTANNDPTRWAQEVQKDRLPLLPRHCQWNGRRYEVNLVIFSVAKYVPWYSEK